MAYGSLMSTHDLGGAFDTAVIHVTSSVHTITNVYAKKDGIVYTGVSTGTNAFDIKVNDKGTYEIWASVDGASTSKVDSVAVSQPEEYNADVLIVSRTLNDNSWAVISAVSAQGKSYWSIGDSKVVNLKEWTNTITSENKNMSAYIIGFRHDRSNVERNGSKNNTITFCLGMLNGKYVCLADSNYSGGPSGYYYISNSPRYWSATLFYGQMRNILENNLIDYFPSDLKSVLLEFESTTRTTNSQPYYGTDIVKISLPCEYEIFGKNVYGANEADGSYIRQYSFFSSGNSKVRYSSYNAPYLSDLCRYWTRTCKDGNNHYFVSVNENGEVQVSSYNTNLGVTPIFCV